MDLESYIAKYTGQTRLQRLLLVASTTADAALSAHAYRLAVQQLKTDGNVRKYKEIFQHLGQQGQGQGQSAAEVLVPSLSDARGQPFSQTLLPSHLPPMNLFDPEWILAAEAANRNDRHVLQGRLSTAQSQLHKEAIRTAYMALAQHGIKTGELQDALGSLLRSMDYSTSRAQTAQISLLILEVCLAANHYGAVRDYVNKVEHTLSGGHATNSNPELSTGLLQCVSIKLKIASGLERLAMGQYAMAAQVLLPLIMTTSTTELEWPGVASAEDIALYASLLVVATQSRATILELSEHPEALELVPTMKDLLSQWSRANYVKCMQAFSNSSGAESLIPQGDLYLQGDKWTALSKHIQETCLLEYLRPYQTVRLDYMSQLFPTITNLEDTLVDLMGRGLIQDAKIDARINVLQKYPPKPKMNMASIERRILDDTHAMLIRLACLEHGLVVRDTIGRGRKGSSSAAARRSLNDHGNMDDDDDDQQHDDDDYSDQEGDARMQDVAESMFFKAENPEDLY